MYGCFTCVYECAGVYPVTTLKYYYPITCSSCDGCNLNASPSATVPSIAPPDPPWPLRLAQVSLICIKAKWGSAFTMARASRLRNNKGDDGMVVMKRVRIDSDDENKSE